MMKALHTTYRNQFKSAMKTENENPKRVIEIWPQLLGMSRV